MTNNKPYVIYHSPCSDGFTAAWCAYRKFGEDGATYIPMSYTDKLPALEPGRPVYFVDFSLSRDDLLALAKTRESVVILDHHVSAAKALAGIEAEASNIDVIFNNDHSGAFLAWSYFIGGEPPRALLDVEDRDLWKFARPDSKEVAAALFSHEQDFSVWDSLMLVKDLYGKLKLEGEALVRMEDKNVEALLPEARLAQILVGGGVVKQFPVVNAPYFLASEVANRLLARFPRAPFAGCYRDTATGRRDWSLRSVADRDNVSAVAVLHGGGGHRNASGLSEEGPDQKVIILPFAYADNL